MKKSHEAVNYRTGREDHRCGICTMYKGPDDCTAVVKPIRPYATCDLFKRDREKVLENRPL
jgi:hypothetical protein